MVQVEKVNKHSSYNCNWKFHSCGPLGGGGGGGILTRLKCILTKLKSVTC